MRRRPRTSTSTDTLVPYTTRFRSDETKGRGRRIEARQAFDIDAGLGCDTERGHAGPVGQLGGQNAYADTIASVNALERSEEHTSELQSLMRNSYAVFCLKKNNTHTCTLQTSR